jgi:DNA-binding transcriptional LysR family regulator
LTSIGDFEMDFALVVRPIYLPPNMAFKTLVTYSIYCAVCTKSHEYAKKPYMRGSQLSDEPLLAISQAKAPQYLEDLRRRLAPHGVTPNIVQQYDDTEALLVGVSGNDGVGLLLECARHEARGDITWLPLRPALEKVDVGVLHRRNPSPYMKKVLAVLEKATVPFRIKQAAT